MVEPVDGETETETVEPPEVVATTEPTDTEATPEQTAPVIAPENQVVVPEAKQKGIVELLMDNLLYIVIGLGVLIVGVAGVWFSKRESKG